MNYFFSVLSVFYLCVLCVKAFLFSSLSAVGRKLSAYS